MRYHGEFSSVLPHEKLEQNQFTYYGIYSFLI